MSSTAASVHVMADRSHDQLLRLSVEACSAMPRLPRAHYIPHMPLLAAHTIIEQLIPAYPVAGARVHKIELAMLKLIRSSLYHLLSSQINAASPAPYDFRFKLSRDGSRDIIPAILSSTVCQATSIRPDTMRDVFWHYLGSTPVDFHFRARCDPGTDDGVLRIPPAAFVQLDVLSASGAVVDTQRFFSAGVEEEDWTFEQWEMAKGLRAPHEDVWEMMPDNLLEKLDAPVDDDLALAESAEPVSFGHNWPPRPHWSSVPFEVPAKTAAIPASGRATPVPPPMSRCSTMMTESTVATPNDFASSIFPSPFASPFVEGKAPLYAAPPRERQPTVRATKGSAIRHMRWTGVPIQRYEGGNVFVRGSGLYLGLPEKTEDRVDYYWTLDEDIEYDESLTAPLETVSPVEVEDAIEENAGWVTGKPIQIRGEHQSVVKRETGMSRLSAMAPRFQPAHLTNAPRLEKKPTDFPAFHFSLPAADEMEAITTRPVSDLLYPLSLPETRSVSPISSIGCPSATTASSAATDPSSRLSPCSSTSSLASSGSKKRRGKRGGKQLRERKERAMAEKLAAGVWNYYEEGASLVSSASDRTIIAH